MSTFVSIKLLSCLQQTSLISKQWYLVGPLEVYWRYHWLKNLQAFLGIMILHIPLLFYPSGDEVLWHFFLQHSCQKVTNYSLFALTSTLFEAIFTVCLQLMCISKPTFLCIQEQQKGTYNFNTLFSACTIIK